MVNVVVRFYSCLGCLRVVTMDPVVLSFHVEFLFVIAIFRRLYCFHIYFFVRLVLLSVRVFWFDTFVNYANTVIQNTNTNFPFANYI